MSNSASPAYKALFGDPQALTPGQKAILDAIPERCPRCKGDRTVQVPSFPTGGYSFQCCGDCKGTGLAATKEKKE